MQSESNEPADKERVGCFWPMFAVSWLSLKGILIALAIVIFLWPLWEAFNSSPLLILRETTLITEPLAEDGLPDYARFVLDRQQEGVTPENNGAIPFWQAMGCSEIDSEYREILFAEIGCPIPAEEGSLLKLSDNKTQFRVGEWIGSKWEGKEVDKELAMDWTDDLIDDALWHPWGEVAPMPLITWVEENQPALDLLIEAAHKPKFYSPPPNLLLDPPDPLFDSLLVAEDEVRSAVRGLVMRAMYRINKDRFEEAWLDLEAALLLGDQMMQQESYISQLVGISSHWTAYQAMHVWFQKNDDPKIARTAHKWLQQRDEPFNMPIVFEYGESLQFIDSLLRMISSTRQSPDVDLGKSLFMIDINAMLRFVREWQDRMIEIASEEDRTKRRCRMDEFENDLDVLGEGFNEPLSLLGVALSRKKRGKAVATMFVSLMMPATSAIIGAEDRSVDKLRLVHVTAALAVWRLEQGNFPDRLEQLVPDLLPELPVDASWNKPFHYERRGNGYLLYAIGTDGEDNGGDNRNGTIIDGEWILDEETDKVTDGVDLVIRLPIPELRLPAPPTQR